MADLHGFNANDYESDFGFAAIPAGKYRAVISNAEWKSAKGGAARYLELTFQILDGPHRNRLLWERLNLDNPSQRAVDFSKARRDLDHDPKVGLEAGLKRYIKWMRRVYSL